MLKLLTYTQVIIISKCFDLFWSSSRSYWTSVSPKDDVSMFSNSLKMVKTDRNMSELWKIVCRNMVFNIRVLFGFVVRIASLGLLFSFLLQDHFINGSNL